MFVWVVTRRSLARAEVKFVNLTNNVKVTKTITTCRVVIRKQQEEKVSQCIYIYMYIYLYKEYAWAGEGKCCCRWPFVYIQISKHWTLLIQLYENSTQNTHTQFNLKSFRVQPVWQSLRNICVLICFVAVLANVKSFARAQQLKRTKKIPNMKEQLVYLVSSRPHRYPASLGKAN